MAATFRAVRTVKMTGTLEKQTGARARDVPGGRCGPKTDGTGTTRSRPEVNGRAITVLPSIKT